MVSYRDAVRASLFLVIRSFLPGKATPAIPAVIPIPNISSAPAGKAIQAIIAIISDLLRQPLRQHGSDPLGLAAAEALLWNPGMIAAENSC